MAAAVEGSSVSTEFRALFSLLTPNESSFQTVQEVPQYVQQIVRKQAVSPHSGDGGWGVLPDVRLLCACDRCSLELLRIQALHIHLHYSRPPASILTPELNRFGEKQQCSCCGGCGTQIQDATPYFMGLMLVELVVAALKADTPMPTINDGLTSLSCGMISRLPMLLFRGFELSTYMFVWERYRFLELPWTPRGPGGFVCWLWISATTGSIAWLTRAFTSFDLLKLFPHSGRTFKASAANIRVQRADLEAAQSAGGAEETAHIRLLQRKSLFLCSWSSAHERLRSPEPGLVTATNLSCRRHRKERAAAGS
ncbi:hypothetical protein WMY93_025825 [Mugilogobius chulae]|uniref:Uncharacterized protein n=1 Tax=Mugilogobius chulae TaxID=88201 RepID=A0AAW0MZ90_9GOBI